MNFRGSIRSVLKLLGVIDGAQLDSRFVADTPDRDAGYGYSLSRSLLERVLGDASTLYRSGA